MNNCPFKIGDRIKGLNPFEPIATVTAFTPRGFEYEYDEVWVVHPRMGWSTSGGEVYKVGFDMWRLATKEDEDKAKNPVTSVTTVSHSG